jgi:signal transduction histidine kinase
MLHEFITLNRGELIRRCAQKAAARPAPPATAAIKHGVPTFLDQVVNTLRSGVPSDPAIHATALLYGHDLLCQGFSVSQVVHGYGDVCQSITDLAVETDAPISTQDFRTLNACLDDAIAGAVTQFGRDQRANLDVEANRENERLGFFAHELRNLLQTAMIAFEVVKTGNVGIGGSTGSVLHRSLVGARDLIARSLAEVRLTQGIKNRERFAIGEFIQELCAAAALESNSRDVTFTLVPIDAAGAGAIVEADRQVLTAVVRNVLQNAFKFTKPRSTVLLRVGASAERVLIEVQDECGGLPAGDSKELFQAFEQRGADRAGVGLGLAFCRWAIEASQGRIDARSIAGVGCVFTIDLPRVPAPAAMTRAAKAYTSV